MVTDESSIGIWMWFTLFAGVNVTWISMDIWLYKHGHELLTTEFKEGLTNPVIGPFLMGAVAFTIVAFLTHMLTTR